MEYATAHLRLINALARSCTSTKDERAYHLALFDSGLERILLVRCRLCPRTDAHKTLRKASTRFYPQLHLELARYIATARNCGFSLGPQILRHLDESGARSQPPAAVIPRPPTHIRSQTDGAVRLPELKF